MVYLLGGMTLFCVPQLEHFVPFWTVFLEPLPEQVTKVRIRELNGISGISWPA